VAHDGPVYQRPFAKPAYIDEVAKAELKLPMPNSASEVKEAVLKLISSPNIADKSWVTNQYDRYVLGNTVLAQPEDSGMVRIDEATHLGVAISTDANANWSYLNPYEGAKLALLEACRNVAAAGAKPLAVTNCLNFGSPEDPGVMWQFAESVRGLADACLEMGLPVTGGNVSFYNQTGDVAILPTPVIGVLGVIDDVRTRTPMSFKEAGLALYLIGETKNDFAGSEWAYLHGQRGGVAPVSDIPTAMRLNDLLVTGRAQKIFIAAHDLSQGGLAAVLTEMTLKNNVGAKIALNNVAVDLFSETPGRVLVAVKDGGKLDALCAKHAIPVSKIGETGGDALVINDVAISLNELRKAYTETLPKLFS
jgi:phosphoribosylformylglycinamidine synthase